MGEKLTPQQQAAVSHRGGNLLVSAAAGSGKTKVLVDRLLGYITDPAQPANVDDFLIITYTKAAAAELRGKIAAKLTDAVAFNPENRHLQQQLQRLYLTKISTVHSFCADILREYAYRLDLSSDFRVADETECLELQSQVLEGLLNQSYIDIDKKPHFISFINSQGFGRDDRQVPELILKVFNSSRCHLSPDEWLEECIASADISDVADAAETVWGQYIIRELRDYAGKQMKALQACVNFGTGVEGMEKPVALLADLIAQLERMCACKTWDEIRAALQIDFGRMVFAKKSGGTALATQIKAVRSACKKGVENRARRFANSNAQVLSDIGAVKNATYGLIELVRQFASDYDKLKQSRHILDFGDLEQKTLDLLLGRKRSGPTTVALEIGSRFREVMVDEYQDSNGVQDAIFSALTCERKNCFMVGDVKQSIYQFRLADPGIFLRKYNEYGIEPDSENRKVLLSTNFRSSGQVIDAVNDVFRTCMTKEVGGLPYGDDEALYEGIPHRKLDDREIELYAIDVQQDTYAEEAAFTAERISQMLRNKQMIREGEDLREITPDDIVILLRSPGSVGDNFRIALEKRGIPCTMGGNIDLLQTEEVSTLYALLQIINNPLQDIPLIAVLTSRLFCFTADELAEIRKKDKQGNFYTALCSCSDPKAIAFLECFEGLRYQSRIHKLTELIGYIFSTTRIDSIFSTLPNGEKRRENLHNFYQYAMTYEANGYCDLTRFLDHLNAISSRGLIISNDEGVSGCVTIMSIHKSKGLEFPVVFLCGLAREFNRESLKATVLCDKELGLGLSCTDTDRRIRYPSIAKAAIALKMSQEGLSEEMRVLYVAMTRARDRLIMTYASDSLEKDLLGLASRMEICDYGLVTTEVDKPGKWILLTALHRTEAGDLFALSGPVVNCCVSDSPWHIRVVVAPEMIGDTAINDTQENRLSPEIIEKMKQGLVFRYPYIEATRIPSKVTATQLKGRYKDHEIAENAKVNKETKYKWRKPHFIEKRLDARDYGTAMHTAMQYISYDSCGDFSAVQQEVKRLVEAGYISSDYEKIINCKKIATFFSTDIGRKIRVSNNVLREFKFSVLDTVDDEDSGLIHEKQLLQGIVDCAILEDDGVTIIDFKTDNVTATNQLQIAQGYMPQVNAYASALSRIFKLPIRKKLLYFFATDSFEVID